MLRDMYLSIIFGSYICQIKLGFVQVNTKSARKMSDIRLLFHALHVQGPFNKSGHYFNLLS